MHTRVSQLNKQKQPQQKKWKNKYKNKKSISGGHELVTEGGPFFFGFSTPTGVWKGEKNRNKKEQCRAAPKREEGKSRSKCLRADRSTYVGQFWYDFYGMAQCRTPGAPHCARLCAHPKDKLKAPDQTNKDQQKLKFMAGGPLHLPFFPLILVRFAQGPTVSP